jgi:hypothetical protein
MSKQLRPTGAGGPESACAAFQWQPIRAASTRIFRQRAAVASPGTGTDMSSHYRRGAIMVALLLLAGCAAKPSGRIGGDTPNEVALSITLLADDLPPEKQAAFTAAVDLLRMTATDRFGTSKFASVTPQMAMQLKGRTPEDVIQMATVYRNAVPVYPTSREQARSAPRD